MNKLTYISIAIWLLLSACGHGHSNDVEYADTLYTPVYAQGFAIYADKDGGRVIESINPWQGSDSVTTQLHISDAPERIIVTSSTFVAMLDALDATDRIVGVSGIDYISNPRIQARRNEITDIGYEGNIDYESLMAADPDLVMLYGVNGASSMEGKLRELGIPYIYIGDYLEESPLGKAEWLVAVGEVINRREVAESLFAEIPERYNALKDRVAEINAQRPGVMLNVPYGDSWFMPSTGSYMAQLIDDAGGNYLYTKDSCIL